MSQVVIASDTSIDLSPDIRISGIGIALLSVTDPLSELAPDIRIIVDVIKSQNI